MSHASSDTSGVGFPPPLLYAGGFVAGVGAHRLLRVGGGPEPPATAGLLGWGLRGAGVLLVASAGYLFRRAGTTPNPTKPTSALVQWGPYRFTRNPMYVGMAVLYVGGSLLLNDPWPLAFLPIAVTLVQRRGIAREEAYPEGRFGGDNRTYKARVRRGTRRPTRASRSGGL